MSLQLRKLDLHVHTPASHDFIDKSVTADQIVEEAQKNGLDAIGITDHNTVDFIDVIKTAATKKNFTIFPGIEVSCGGSKNGSIHVIGLFDTILTKDDLQKIIGKLDIKGSGEDALTSKSVSNVIDIIKQEGGLAILAHANSSHGALSDIKGNPRTDIVQNPNLCAVEATQSDFEKPVGKRLLEILDGSDPVYKRHLPVYKASDNRNPNGNGHCHTAIGSSFTYFKMGELTLESLRQCFEDPSSRIIQDYEEDKIKYSHPVIKTLSISNGFLENQRFDFHAGMTSIIGGTGTGKSLAIEFIRFAFDLEPSGPILSDHKEKLLKQLGLNGEIKLVFQDNSGVEYEITRKYDNPREPYGSFISCVNLSNGKSYKGNISSIFPILIYSQNEILEITRNTDAQLKLLDNFRNFESYRDRINDIKTNLRTYDRKLIQAIQESESLASLQKQLQTCTEKIDKIQAQLGKSNPTGTLDVFIQLSEEKGDIETKIEEYDTLLDKIDSMIEELVEDTPSAKKSPVETIDIIEKRLADSYSTLIKELRRQKVEITKEKQKSDVDFKEWMKAKKFVDAEKKYTGDIKLRKKEEELDTLRKLHVKEKKELTLKITTAQKAATLYKDIRKERNKLLSELKSLKDNYFQERTKQANLINTRSGGKLQIIIQEGDNKKIYSTMLKKIKVGSHAEKKEIDEIIDSVTPIELVEKALDRDVKGFSSLCKVTEIKGENIVNQLTEYSNLPQSLAMQYDAYPEDLIQINYQKNDGKHYPLSELSMGQKADALIMIALGDGEMPVIIDQPEDALDVPSIWADICTRLRISKHARQFIFTTHNSSISVSSDSDEFIVLAADGAKGWISKSGSIDQKNIKDDVVGHLEGGYDAYELKRKKYGL